MDETHTLDIDNLTWEEWAPSVCALENGADCTACEG
jgi:hypothetical protein